MKKLSKDDLEEIGVVSLGSKIYPNRFLIPLIETEVDLIPPYSIEDVFKIIFERARILGIKEGMEKKCSEIKEILGID